MHTCSETAELADAGLVQYPKQSTGGQRRIRCPFAEKILKIISRSLRRSLVSEFRGRTAELVDAGLVQYPKRFTGGQRRILARKNTEN